MRRDKSVDVALSILEADMARKSPHTKRAYRRFAREFLEKHNDFSRPGIVAYINELSDKYSPNTARLGYAAIAYLCRALEVRFPLDARHLPPPPGEGEINAQPMPKEDIEQIIAYWKQYPGEYLTSLAFLSSVYAPRLGELTNIQIGNDTLIIDIEKRRSRTTREHLIPNGNVRYLEGYEKCSYGVVNGTFGVICKRAGVVKPKIGAYHCVRRTLNTELILAGLSEVVVRRFMRWTQKTGDMPSVYFHKPNADIDKMVFEVHPFLKLW